jgi:hypothetical protein
MQDDDGLLQAAVTEYIPDSPAATYIQRTEHRINTAVTAHTCMHPALFSVSETALSLNGLIMTTYQQSLTG